MSNDEINIDLSKYKDRIGQRVPPGRYRVYVEDAYQEKAASNNMMIILELRVQGGEYDGATIIDRLVQTENSMFRTVGFMQALGLPTPKKRLRINLKTFRSKVLDVDVDDGDPYMGRVKSEVRGYLQPEKPAKSLTPEEEAAAMETFSEGGDAGGSADPWDTPEGTDAATPPDEVDLDKIDLG